MSANAIYTCYIVTFKCTNTSKYTITQNKQKKRANEVIFMNKIILVIATLCNNKQMDCILTSLELTWANVYYKDTRKAANLCQFDIGQLFRLT